MFKPSLVIAFLAGMALSPAYETFVWANTLSGITVAEMMAPAIIGMLFNSDRRQTPSLVASG